MSESFLNKIATVDDVDVQIAGYWLHYDLLTLEIIGVNIAKADCYMCKLHTRDGNDGYILSIHKDQLEGVNWQTDGDE